MFSFFSLMLVLAIGLCLYISLAPKLPNMKEGMWEITGEAKIPANVMSQFFKKAQYLTKENPVPQIFLPGYDCKIAGRPERTHIIGNYVLWKVWCVGPGGFQGNGNGSIRYRGNKLKGNIQIHDLNGEQKPFKINLSGCLIGECS